MCVLWMVQMVGREKIEVRGVGHRGQRDKGRDPCQFLAEPWDLRDTVEWSVSELI